MLSAPHASHAPSHPLFAPLGPPADPAANAHDLSPSQLALRDGGYFIGVLPEGKRVLALLDRKRAYASRMLRIAARWEGEPAAFGSAYNFDISDTVTAGHGETGGSLEYLVFTGALLQSAALFGLRPIAAYGDPKMDALFVDSDRVRSVGRRARARARGCCVPPSCAAAAAASAAAPKRPALARAHRRQPSHRAPARAERGDQALQAALRGCAPIAGGGVRRQRSLCVPEGRQRRAHLPAAAPPHCAG